MSFPNLAHSNPSEKVIEEVSDICQNELEKAGIPFQRYNFLWDGKQEVPSRVMGFLGPFSFNRNWYYWVVSGNSYGLPPEIAEALWKKNPSARVDGHCASPSPREAGKGFAICKYHVDTPEALKDLADAILSVMKSHEEHMAANNMDNERV